MGEGEKQSFQLSFNRFLRVAFQGSRVTSDGGLILVRELDERLGFRELVAQHLTDPRANNARFSLVDLLRQSVYSRLAGYEDVNDAERLSHDPTFRLIGSERIWDRGAALASRLQSFETELLAEEENFAGLAQVNRELIGRVEAINEHYRTVLDMDSTEIPVKRPVGRPGKKPLVRYKGFLYQAAGWKMARRVVAKVEHPPGELFPRVGFIATNLTLPSRAVVRFYNKRGTAEQWIKEGKQAVKMTRLSCHRFRSNEVRLCLSVIAYNLGNLWRRLGLPQRVQSWSLTSLQQRLVKTGGRLVKHARYYWLLLPEGHLHRRLFRSMLLRMVAALPLPDG